MKNITILFLITLGTFMSSCSNSSSENGSVSTENQVIKSVEVSEFEKLINEKTGILLDVRTADENAEGNISGSKLIDVTDHNFEKNISSLDKNVPVLVYCRSGKRSMKAAEILKEKGFKSIYNLKGGFLDWSESH